MIKIMVDLKREHFILLCYVFCIAYSGTLHFDLAVVRKFMFYLVTELRRLNLPQVTQ